MKSHIFYTDTSQRIADATRDLLNQQVDYLSSETALSPRAVGDAIQSILERNFAMILGDLAVSYTADYARRAMGDLSFEDKDGMYYLVDVKTHREGTSFNMPNLTSVERLTRLYQEKHNMFAILLIHYAINGTHATVSRVDFAPIEFISWDSLSIGALGWGQIQITNTNRLLIERQSRKLWMQTLCERLLDFYPREIEKIHKRITYFETVASQWQSMPDVWA